VSDAVPPVAPGVAVALKLPKLTNETPPVVAGLAVPTGVVILVKVSVTALKPEPITSVPLFVLPNVPAVVYVTSSALAIP
jgi:hypothetical protein